MIYITRALKCETLGVVCVPKSRIIRQGRVMRMLDKINCWAGSCNLGRRPWQFSIGLGRRR